MNSHSHGHAKARESLFWWFLLAAGLWACSGGDGYSKPPVVQASIHVAAEHSQYTNVELRTDAKGSGYLWWVTGPDRQFIKFYAVGGDRSFIVFTGPPGKYNIMLAVLQKSGAAEQSQATIIIQGEAKPDPVNPPDPPTPDPIPVPGKRWVIVVEQMHKTPPAKRAIVLSPRMRNWVKSKGHIFRVLDVDSFGESNPLPEIYKPYIEAAKGQPLPLLFVGDSTGKIIGEGQPLESSDGVIEAIQKAGG